MASTTHVSVFFHSIYPPIDLQRDSDSCWYYPREEEWAGPDKRSRGRKWTGFALSWNHHSDHELHEYMELSAVCWPVVALTTQLQPYVLEEKMIKSHKISATPGADFPRVHLHTRTHLVHIYISYKSTIAHYKTHHIALYPMYRWSIICCLPKPLYV